ncbi:MAG: DUF2844 domain-containing protein [Ramlibacter sp.]
MRSSTKSLLIGAVLAAGLSTGWAALGGKPAKFGPHVAASQSNAVSTGQAAYTESQKMLDSGTTVHEYVDAGGNVFAVSWSGPFLPDLKEILGEHFDVMTAQQRKQRAGGRSPLHIKQSDVVIDSEGHMGAFQGRAWLPAKLPAGFDPQAIK